MKRDQIIRFVKVSIGDCQFSLMSFTDYYPQYDLEQLHFHYHYEIHIVTAPQFTFSTPERNIPARQGEMVLFEPKEPHCMAPTGTTTVLDFTLDKDKQSATEVFPRIAGLLHLCAGVPIPVPNNLTEKITGFSVSPGKQTIAELCEEQNLACAIVEQILLCFEESVRSRNLTLKEFNIQPADLETVMLDYYINRPDLSLSEVADMMNYSEKQILRLMQRNYGMTFTNYRNNQRIETAVYLLRHRGELSNEEISVLAGFNTLSNFYRCFRDTMGVKPNDIRGKGKKPEDTP